MVGLPVDLALHTPTGQRAELGHVEQGNSIPLRSLCHRLGYRMIGAGRQTGSDTAAIGGECVALCDKIDLCGLAVSDRAGLVQSRPAQLAAFFQLDTALDKNAVAGSGGQAADDADRRGNHQGAWAGNHQQNQCTVNPVHPCRAHEKRGQQCDGDG